MRLCVFWFGVVQFTIESLILHRISVSPSPINFIAGLPPFYRSKKSPKHVGSDISEAHLGQWLGKMRDCQGRWGKGSDPHIVPGPIGGGGG